MGSRPIPEWIRRILGEAARDPETLRRNAERVSADSGAS